MRNILIVLTVLLIVPVRFIRADEFLHGRVLSADRNRGRVAIEVPYRPGDGKKRGWGNRRSPQSLRGRQSPPAADVMDRHHPPAYRGMHPRVLVQGPVDKNRGKGTSSTVPGNVLPVPPETDIRHHDDTTGVRHRIGRENRPVEKQVPPGGGSGSHRKKGGAPGGHHGR
jgi:hypothetical protein